MKTTNAHLHLIQPDDELAFAYKVRRALDERVAVLPKNVENRLSDARKVAIAHKKAENIAHATVSRPRFAGVFSHGFSSSFDGEFNWIKRVGLIIPVFVLIAGSIGIYQYEEERRIDELADLDAAVLADELPINAYLDHGFDTYLSKHGE